MIATNTEGSSKKLKTENQNREIEYPNISYALLPVPHGEGLPIPTTPLHWKDNLIIEMNDIEDTSHEDIDVSEKIFGPAFRPKISSEPHFICSNDLNDLVHELGISTGGISRLQIA
ncbi:hypothetical protein AVEN_25969-1 [Araneus ventricosus]|uniref:Uncharacterized protein n=1 Tax=Araneus ventricosus TaxID=182803 RepID=A0A4Y2FFX8_ARAVE|nr:hypothetical protein AVEN_25969-1 [Araneus ventricosus]